MEIALNIDVYFGMVLGVFLGSFGSWALFNIIHNVQVQQLSEKQKRRVLTTTETAKILLRGEL